MTPGEARLWTVIRRGRLGARFRRQVPIGDWIADFACFDPKLVIEVDDKSHDLKEAGSREHHLATHGYTVLRFTNREIALNVEFTEADIQATIERLRDAHHEL